MNIIRPLPAKSLCIALFLGGCGTFVPNLQEIGDDADGMLLVQAIVESVHCEVRNAIATVYRRDDEAATDGAREWAIRIIEHYSGEKFSDTAKKQLLNYRLSDAPARPAGVIFPTPGGGHVVCHYDAGTQAYSCGAAAESK
jgi:hypothetical protein